MASLRNSPYPLHYTLRWPWYFHHPSVRNGSGLRPLPDRWRSDTAPERDRGDVLRLVVAGDIMVLNGDRTPVLCPELCRLVGSADYFVANLEAPVGAHAPDPDKRYTFLFHMARDVLLGIQAQLGLPFDRWLLGNANNHSADAGLDGFESSYAILDGLGVRHLGLDTDDGRLRVIEHAGMRIGVMAWTQWMNCQVAEVEDRVLWYDDARRLGPEIKAREQLDLLVGMPHWDYEFQHFPARRTRAQARALVDAGFDLLLGSHTHVLQPCEWIGTAPCFYMLGNFCGLGIAWPVKIIPLLELEISRDAASGVAVTAYRLHYFHQVDGERETAIMPLSEMPTAVVERARQRISKVYHMTDAATTHEPRTAVATAAT